MLASEVLHRQRTIEELAELTWRLRSLADPTPYQPLLVLAIQPGRSLAEESLWALTPTIPVQYADEIATLLRKIAAALEENRVHRLPST